MRIRRATLRAFELPLHRPLATAHGPIRVRSGWLVELEDEDGRIGFGEATPLPEFGTEDAAACRSALERALSRSIVEEYSVAPAVRSFWPHNTNDPTAANEANSATPCARAAVEAALFDLAAKRSGRSLAGEIRAAAGFSGEPATSVATQALVGGDAPEEVQRSAGQASAAGFEAFKLKLATGGALRDPARDLERVAALRETVGRTARLRLDANEAWTVDEAMRALARLASFDVDYVEQPVERADLRGLARLSREAAIPVAADEALQGPGLSACLEARAARILIVKPAALGGVAKAVELAARARAEGLRLVWSTLIDGAVGRALPLALAAGLGPEDEVHGLGTAHLLAADLSGEHDGVESGEARLVGGRLLPTRGSGIGFVPGMPRREDVEGGHARRGDAGSLDASPSFEVTA